MLPPNIQALINQLIDLTKNNVITWHFDYMQRKANCSSNGMHIVLLHEYNELEEMYQFNIWITDQSDSHFNFSVLQKFRSYDDVKYLYDMAQASNITFPQF